MDSNHYYHTVDYQSKHLQVIEMKKVYKERREQGEEEDKYTFQNQFLDNINSFMVSRSLCWNRL